MTMELGMLMEDLIIQRARDLFKFLIDILKLIQYTSSINTKVSEEHLSYLNLVKDTAIDVITNYIQLKDFLHLNCDGSKKELL